jgi:hypothetical protein
LEDSELHAGAADAGRFNFVEDFKAIACLLKLKDKHFFWLQTKEIYYFWRRSSESARLSIEQTHALDFQ